MNIAQRWIKHGQENFNNLRAIIQSALKTFFSGLTGMAALFILFGLTVIMVLNMAEHTAALQNQTSSSTGKPATEIKNEPPVKKAPQHAMKQPSNIKAAFSLLTEHAKHRVTRSDESKVDSKKTHEFKTGSYQFYPELADKTWLSSYKRGESRIDFKHPLSISKIIIHKASVGRLAFKRGFVYLEIQVPNSSNWLRIFERKGDDVDIKVVIDNIQKYSTLIKAVRIRFKTSGPITIGPIDLLP